MFTKTLTCLTIGLFLAAGPVLAQHGGMHEHQHAQNGPGEAMDMAGMHGEQMGHMSVMMDQMNEMMQQMHGDRAAMLGQDHQGLHDEMMQGISQDMDRMLQAMESMFGHLRNTMDDESVRGDAAAMERMNQMADHLDRMMQAGRGMMATMAPAEHPADASGHDAHRH